MFPSTNTAANPGGYDGTLNLPKTKPWVELTADEKIERMHEVILSLQSVVYGLRGEVHSLRSKLANHKHDMQDGSVMERMSVYSSNSEQGLSSFKPDPTKVYF